ncbi:MAG: SRPBCC domain-containing protein [Bacteroidota bacterium]|nr:SRPBCC domain-containing protein [Bacteroidota bacterium]
MSKTIITIKAIVNSQISKVWDFWTSPVHIIKWNHASDDWHTTTATNDLKVGGKFSSRMEAKDGSLGFDFWGVYDEVVTNKKIAYTLSDERKVGVTFTEKDNGVEIISMFEAENENPVEMQKEGWQMILNNFKKYTETN